jgi:hypothetical protein
MLSIRSCVCVCGVAVGALTPLASAVDPWADSVVSYAPGSGPAPGLTLAASALGEPARFSPNSNPEWAAVVSPFSPAYLPEHIVSLGTGGALVVAFAEPVLNDVANPFGIDLLVFGNAGMQDPSWPAGVTNGQMFGSGRGAIEVSADGNAWFTLPVLADAMYPTVGYSDVTNGYANAPGGVLSDFTRPVDPLFSVTAGMTMADILAGYAGSGGGAGVDIGAVGLASVSFVRITNPTGAFGTVEIDGLADVTPVPSPATLGGVAMFALVALGRRRA